MSDSDSPEQFDVVIVGAGFSGMYLVERCRSLGFSCVVLEQGSDVGGTWYWNRYPGARCDIPTIEYSYSFDPALEQEWNWSELMGAQPEILKYANHVADRFDLRRDMRFGTRVEAASFDESSNRWTVTSKAGECFESPYLILATGCLSKPNWPAIKGRESFQGKVLHTALWPHEPVTFHGERVGIIGTGSSAIQSIPEIAQTAEHLHVFQRTPNYTMPAENHPLTDEFRSEIKANYAELRDIQRHSLAGMARYGVMGRIQEIGEEKIVDVGEEERRRRLAEDGLPSLRRYADVGIDMEANELACDIYREYVAQVVDDEATAHALMPRDYPLGCKRQVVDIDYYETFNRDNVSVVDLRVDPIVEITERGIRTESTDFEFDVLIYATGFDAMTGAINDIEVTGREGRLLRDEWSAGPRTYLGLQSVGFPNLFMITGPGSPSVLSNMMVSIEQHCEWVTDCMAYLRDRNYRAIEATLPAQDAWVQHVNDVAAGTMLTTESCNSWYLGANVPGKPRVFMPYVGGLGNYRKRCNDVAAADYEGFVLP